MKATIKEFEKFIVHSSNIKESRSNGSPPTTIWMETNGKSCSFLENPSFIIKVAIANAITATKHIDNPYKLASPYEFFIVVDRNGAYHLDKNYTPFGKVVKGMGVVDKISDLETDRREWPIDNVKIKVDIID